MGALAVVINHSKKQFFFCDTCKWREVWINESVMYGILNHIKSQWRPCKFELSDEYKLDWLVENGYEEIEIDWKMYREDYKEE